jgi:hypothetical protein
MLAKPAYGRVQRGVYDIPFDLGIVAYFSAAHDGFTTPNGKLTTVRLKGQNEFVKNFTKSVMYTPVRGLYTLSCRVARPTQSL